MQSESHTEKNSLIRNGLLLELAVMTIWKLCSSLSVELMWYAFLEVILAQMGIFMLICGMRELKLEENSKSWLYNSHEKIYAWTVMMVCVFPVWHLIYIASQFGLLEDRQLWWKKEVAAVGNYDIGLTVCFILIIVAVWYMVSDLIMRIQNTAETCGWQEVKILATRLRWWRRWVILGCIILGGFYFLTGDSKSIPVESGLISAIFLLLHWGYVMGLFSLLRKMETNVSDGRGEEREVPYHKWDKMSAGILGIIVVTLFIIAATRYSSEKDFRYYYYNNDKIILEEYVGGRMWVKVPAHIDGKQVIGLSESFRRNKRIRKVWISEGIQWLGAKSFQYCENLKEIHLPASLTLIGNRCFYDSGVERITLKEDNLQTVGIDAFASTPWKNTPKLEKWPQGKGKEWAVLGETLVSFYSNGADTEVLQVPDNVKKIADYGLLRWSDDKITVRELYLPSGLEKLGKNALAGVQGLKDLHLSDSVLYIHENNLSERPDDFVVWGKKGSEAERMAQQMGVCFAEEGQPRPVEYKPGSSKEKEEESAQVLPGERRSPYCGEA